MEYRWSGQTRSRGISLAEIELLNMRNAASHAQAELEQSTWTTSIPRMRPLTWCGYRPLDHTRLEIRLLRILPGSWTAPLHCILEAVPLDDCPSYQALSYTWGERWMLRTISINDEPFEITTNLWSAIRRLRRSSEQRRIWVDAICINQTDANEKSSQLGLMGSIYSGADDVLIWLGDSISAEGVLTCSSDALENGKDLTWLAENIENVCQEVPFHDCQSEAMGAFAVLYLLSIDGHWHEKALFEIDDEQNCHIAARYVSAWQAFRQLLQLPWWSRIWVLQEALLARKATMIIGSTSVPWELVYHFCDSYQSHLPAGACCHSAVTWSMPHELWSDIILMRSTFWSFNSTRMILLQSSSSDYAMFWEILWLSRYKKASNPRDKVYGLLGLLDRQENLLLEANYSLTEGEVFCMCTEALIKTDRSLRALVGPRLNRSGFPTWTIDLLPDEQSGNISHLNNVLRRKSSDVLFSAGGKTKLYYSLHADKLTLRGFRFDSVKRTAPAWRDGYIAQSIKEWQELAFPLHCNETPYQSGCTHAQAFWRTIIRDVIEQPGGTLRRACSTDEMSFLRFRQWLSQPAMLPDTVLWDSDFTNFRKTFFIASQHQSFFTTCNDYMGLADSAKVQDEIWLLSGGNVPFILRPYPDDSEHAGCYSLVGDCYAHGMMDGELIGEDTKPDWKEIVLV